GEAMAIKDPTAAVFRPQSGSNLLIIGQQDEPALAIMAASLIGLAAQLPADTNNSSTARFYVLDGTPVDHMQAGVLSKVGEVVPQPVKSGGFRDLTSTMSEIAAEVERRQRDNDFEAPPIFLFVHGLQRLRDLRRQDDEFSFSREEKPASPAQQFATITREG